MLPRIAIVGRPNVGKSTLFNRLLGYRKAIVHKESGTTRDYVRETFSWLGRTFCLVDTGGFEFATRQTLQSGIEKQVEQAISDSDLLLWVVDVSTGPLPLDERLAEKLRRSHKKVFLVINKADNPAKDFHDSNFFRLGIADMFPVSALHGLGTGELLDRIVHEFPHREDTKMVDPLFTVAIVGEPNSGKSTYLNQLLKQERVLVSDLPGTTRDSIEEVIVWEGKSVQIIDTAGLKARSKVKEVAAFFSLARTREAIQKADVVLLFFDAARGFLKNSKTIARLIYDEGKACILVANKWDLVKGFKNEYELALKRGSRFLEFFTIVFISALNRQGIENPIEKAYVLWRASQRKIPTKDLNKFLKIATEKNPPPPTLKFKFLVQKGSKPPSFVLFAKHRNRLPESYFLYLENQLVRYFGFEGIPIRIFVREAAKKQERF